jgi:hypothetical protein
MTDDSEGTRGGREEPFLGRGNKGSGISFCSLCLNLFLDFRERGRPRGNKQDRMMK